MHAYYNDSDPFCAQWLKNLIAAGAIPAGIVDDRSIAEVEPEDLRGFRQCHFFAGIGGWAYALQLAGWPPDRPLWTGSCPCQPFSSAGRQGGALDERHLWPRWLRLIGECRPDAILGEQVEGAVGFGWVDRVFADLEAEGYACGAAVLGAHSVGAPHIRQRLFWVAHNTGAERRMADPDERACRQGSALGNGWDHRGDAVEGAGSGSGRDIGWVADADQQRQREAGHTGTGEWLGGNGSFGGLGDAARREMGRARQPWQDSVWLPCLDGKARRVVASVQPLAHAGECICGLRLGQLCACGERRPSRVGMLRGSGNAIAPAVAAEFIAAVMETIPG